MVRGLCNDSRSRYTSSKGVSRYASRVQCPRAAETLDDAALAQAVAGAAPRIDSEAEAELYRRFAPRVRLYGLRHLRDRHAAADLAQQVLVMTLERLRAGKIREPERLASYVLGMCRLVVLELKRGAARRDNLLATYGRPSEAEETPDPQEVDKLALSVCLERLSPRERSILLLSFFADKSADEVAREFALTPGNVRVIRHRALVRLRECITGERTP